MRKAATAPRTCCTLRRQDSQGRPPLHRVTANQQRTFATHREIHHEFRHDGVANRLSCDAAQPDQLLGLIKSDTTQHQWQVVVREVAHASQRLQIDRSQLTHAYGIAHLF